MKNANLLLVTFFLAVSSVITPASAATKYTPNASRSLTSPTTSYCQGGAASAIRFIYYSCVTGTGTAAGTAITINWYSNTTNSTTGGTLVSSTTGTSGL